MSENNTTIEAQTDNEVIITTNSDKEFKTTIEAQMDNEVIIITNSAQEFNTLAQYTAFIRYTNNPIGVVSEFETTLLNEIDTPEKDKTLKVKEIYLCFTDVSDEGEVYRTFNEESFIAEKFKKLGIAAQSVCIDAHKKSLQIPSIYDVKNSEELEKYVNKLMNSQKDKRNSVEIGFIKNRKPFFMQEQHKRADMTPITTGYKSLDKILGGLHAGLYVLTGASSLGKTALMTNIAECLALQKKYVLYYSLEMKESNLISRGISRRMYLENEEKSLGFKDIENGCIYAKKSKYSNDGELLDNYEVAEDFYFNKIGEYLTICEANLLSTSHSDVREKANLIKDFTGQSPIIIVDYLQQMSSCEDKMDANKTAIIESNIIGLKQLSKDLDTPLLVISSLSRADALEAISMKSFAQNSMIEYKAEVCLGLALEVIHSEDFKVLKSISEKRMLVNESLAEKTRTVRLSVVKNRFGIAFGDVLMSYTPKFNMYEECKSVDINKIEKTKQDVKEGKKQVEHIGSNSFEQVDVVDIDMDKLF